jgi:hypothetical protein
MKPGRSGARSLAGVALVAIGLVVAGLSSAAQAPDPLVQKLPQRFTALAANLNPSGPAATVIEILINRWSTDAERDQLFGALRDKGEAEMLKLLKKQRSVGRIRTTGALGQDLSYASQEATNNGGRDIVLMTDRSPDYGEIVSLSKSTEYQFTYVELHLKSNGVGDGALLPAAKLALAGRLLVVDNFDERPIQLTTVKLER